MKTKSNKYFSLDRCNGEPYAMKVASTVREGTIDSHSFGIGCLRSCSVNKKIY